MKSNLPAPEIEITASRPEDAAALSACLDAVARERKHLALTQGFPPEGTRQFIEFLTANRGVHLTARLGHQVVGWCDLTPQGMEGFRHTVRLGMGLLPACRGHGLGTRLLQRAIADTRALGYEKIELEVFASNAPAIRLYQKQGFLPEGRRVRARKLDDVYDDVLLYGLFL